MTKISLPGGTIEPHGSYTTHDGQRPFWRATSSWTGQTIECQTRGLAEFFVWITNERYASAQMRGAL